MTRPLRQLVFIAFGIVAAWCAVAVLHMSESLRFAAVTTGSIEWEPVLCYQLTTALNWAVYTPVIIFVTERMPLRGPQAARMLLGLIVVAVIVAILRAATGAAIQDLAEGVWPRWEFVWYSLERRFHRNFFFVTVIMAITQLMLAQRHFAAADAASVALRGAVAQAELEKLRASLQPQFILRALDAIAARIESRPRGADTLLADFGDLLRNMLSAAPREDWTLRDELERIEPYLAFERERSGGAFTSRVALPGELLDARIPSMLLLSLVQDALARQFARGGGRIEIRGMRIGERLCLEFEECNATAPPDRAILDEVRARLVKVFDTRAAVRTYRKPDDGSVTALGMPLLRRGLETTDDSANSDSRRRAVGAGAPADAART